MVIDSSLNLSPACTSWYRYLQQIKVNIYFFWSSALGNSSFELLTTPPYATEATLWNFAFSQVN